MIENEREARLALAAGELAARSKIKASPIGVRAVRSLAVVAS